MSKVKTSQDIGFKCFKVRIVIQGGAIIHVLSRTEPVIHCDLEGAPTVISVDWEIVNGTEHGDSVGFIRWHEVSAITWRAA